MDDSAHRRSLDTVLNRLAIDANEHLYPLPFVLRTLVSTAANRDLNAPACIVLPDVDGVAEIVAALAALVELHRDWPDLRAQFVTDRLRCGAHVRSVRDGRVIEYLGIDGDFVRLRYLDAAGTKSNAALLVPRDVAFSLEPTERKRPMFKSGEKPEKAFPTAFDLAAGTKTCGNTGIIRDRIILLGSRQRFEDALTQAAVVLNGDFKGAKVRALRNFVWGYLDDTGAPVVTNPRGATGQPLVAVTQDVLLLQHCASEPGGRGKVLVSSRFELVRRNLELVQRFGDANRIVVLAPAERRDDARKLRDLGWLVWEPQGGEVRARETGAVRGLPGLARSLRSLSADLSDSFYRVVPAQCEALREGFDHLRALGHALPADEEGMDPRLDEIRHTSSDLFFSISSWLDAPGKDDVDHIHGLTAVLKRHYPHAERCLGSERAQHLPGLMQCADRFFGSLSGSVMTPKGAALLELAKRVSGDVHRHAFVTDFGADRDRVVQFLENKGASGHQCLTVQGLREARSISRIVAFGLIRKDGFARIADPWPALSVTFSGYDYETEIYERRLTQRSRSRKRLSLDDGPRSRITRFAQADFGDRKDLDQSRASPEQEDAVLSSFDRAVGTRRTTARRPVIARRLGEVTVQARYMSFCGSSWAAFTEEHEVLAIRGLIGATSTVTEMDVSDLMPGTHIMIRESGDKDVIREMAEHEIGEDAYDALRERAGLWKRAIRQARLDVNEIARRLARVGVNRSLATLRGWLKSESRIGPRAKSDLIGIMEAFPLDGTSEARWQDCAAAIAEVRGVHLSVGTKLTGMLAKQCQNVLIDAGEHEQRVELDFGSVWIVEIAEIDDNLTEWPVSSVNRLNRVERRLGISSIDELLAGLT